MLWSTPLQAAALFASTGISIWAVVIVRARRGVPGSTPFAWLMVAVALWSLTSALHLLIADREAQILISQVQYLGIVATGPLWLLFASEYARAAWVKLRGARAALCIVPLVTIGAAMTNEWHHALWASITVAEDGSGRLVYAAEPWYWVNVGTIYVQMAVGSFVLARALRLFPPPYRRQTWAILLGAVIPWIGNAAYHSGLTPPGLDPTPLAFTVSGVCFAWGLFRYRLFGLVPVARDMVIDSMDDGVLVLDSQRRLIDLNPAAQRYTGCSEASLGRPVHEVVAWWDKALADDAPLGSGMPMVVRTEPGPRYFEIKVTAVRDSQARFVGWLVTIPDINHADVYEARNPAVFRRVADELVAWYGRWLA